MNLSIKFCFFSRRKYTGDPHTCHAHTPNGKHDKNDCMPGSFPKFRHSLSTMIFCIFSLCNLDETFFSLGRIIKHDPAVFKVEDDLLKIVLKTEPFQILIIKFFCFSPKISDHDFFIIIRNAEISGIQNSIQSVYTDQNTNGGHRYFCPG